MDILELFVVFAGFVATVVGIRFFLRISPSIGLLDVPNERSSHTKPTPRGGGLVIALVGMLLYVLVSAWIGENVDWTFIFCALLITFVGFADDLFSSPPLFRLAVHIFAAALMVYSTGSFNGVYLLGTGKTLNFGAFSPIITVFLIVWITNAFNFMDGIDGIAGVQGLSAGLGWTIFGLITGEQAIAAVGSIFIGICAGFLVFNWPPAKIFMGDAGSTFLGFSLAVLPLIYSRSSKIPIPELLILCIIFSWLFIYDTVLTRLIQITRGAKFWKPHRDHQYQRLVVAGHRHRSVSLFFGLTGASLAVIGSYSLTFKGNMEFLTLALVFGASILLSLWTLKKALT